MLKVAGSYSAGAPPRGTHSITVYATHWGPSQIAPLTGLSVRQLAATAAAVASRTFSGIGEERQAPAAAKPRPWQYRSAVKLSRLPPVGAASMKSLPPLLATLRVAEEAQLVEERGCGAGNTQPRHTHARRGSEEG